MALEQDISQTKDLTATIADSTRNCEKNLSAALNGITSKTEKANGETAKAITTTANIVRSVAKNETSLLEKELECAKKIFNFVRKGGNDLEKLNKTIETNPYISKGKIDPDFLDELKDKSEKELRTMGINPQLVKDAKEEEARRKVEEKEKTKGEAVIKKFADAISNFKKNVSESKDDLTSGKLDGWGLLGAVSGAIGGWNAETKYEKAERERKEKEEKKRKEKEQQAKNDTADTTILDNKKVYENIIENEDGEGAGDKIYDSFGAQTLEERAHDIAMKRGYTYDSDSDSYINTTNDGKDTIISKEDLINEVKADAEKRYKERGGIEERKEALSVLKEVKAKDNIIERNRKNYENSKEGKVEKLASEKGYIYDEDSNTYINVSNNGKDGTISGEELAKEVKANEVKTDAIKADTKKNTRLDGRDIINNNISTFDTHTGNTLSNTAMNLEKGKEKSVTIVSDNSAKISNENTTAFSSPISSHNGDSAVKYFNDKI